LEQLLVISSDCTLFPKEKVSEAFLQARTIISLRDLAAEQVSPLEFRIVGHVDATYPVIGQRSVVPVGGSNVPVVLVGAVTATEACS
jgi:hypothetical protein